MNPFVKLSSENYKYCKMNKEHQLFFLFCFFVPCAPTFALQAKNMGRDNDWLEICLSLWKIMVQIICVQLFIMKLLSY